MCFYQAKEPQVGSCGKIRARVLLLMNEKLAEVDCDAINLEESFENLQIILVEALKEQHSPRKSNLSTNDFKETN